MNYYGRSGWMSILPHPDELKTFARRIGEALLPASCLLCGDDSGSTLLCPQCAADLPALPAQICPICADRTTHGERCGACLKDPPHFDRTLALFRYDFPADRLIHALKYSHQLPVAKWSGQRLAARLADENFDLVLPLPLHPERLRQRGFNQAAEIAREFQICRFFPADRSILLRTRATTPQAELPPKERRKNVRGAFECQADLRGRHILLIDDVLTTGSTANECARVLKLHGATSVTVAVVARALRD